MELSPQAVAAATFKTVKRGYDPDEVRAYLVEVSASLESSHQHATAMEARARAAIAKLQDATQNGAPATVAPVPDGAEAISRALLLAQRTADVAIAEARSESAALAAQAQSDAAAVTARAEAEAASLTAVARTDAATVLDQANATAAKLVDDARADARRMKSDEQMNAEREVRELAARREVLLSDVEALEQFVSTERDRLRAVSASMQHLADAPSGGLGSLVRPELSAGVDAFRVPNSDGTTGSVSEVADGDLMPPPVAEPLITGQIPIVGAQPLVSPMPSSNDEARSMWHEAELADDAAAAAGDTVLDVQIAAGEITSDDQPTPANGLRIGGEELH